VAVNPLPGPAFNGAALQKSLYNGLRRVS